LIDAYKGKIPDKILEDVERESKANNLTKAQMKEVLERVEKIYEEVKINPGESIGIVTAESFGEPGTQMCVRYDEKIILKYENICFTDN